MVDLPEQPGNGDLLEALRASEAKFSAVFDQSPLALTITSFEDGRLIDVNESFVQLSGYTREEALGRTPEDLGLWVEPELRAERFARLQAGEGVSNIEARFRLRSGEERIGVIGSAVVQIDSRPCVVSSVVDITERKRAEEALHEAHAWLRAAMDAGRLGAWDWDIPRNKITWTDRVYELYGLEPGTFGGTVEDFSRLVHPEDRPAVQSALESTLARQAPYELEFRIVHSSGETRWVFTRAEVVTDSAGTPARLIGITQDITARKHSEQRLREQARLLDLSSDARKQAEEAFRRSDERLRLAQSYGRVGVWSWDMRTGRMSVEPEMERLYGMAPGTLRSYEDWTSRVHPEDLARGEAERERMLAANSTFEIEFRIRHTSGSERWLLSRGRGERDSSGRLCRMLGVNIDITERKEIEEALKRADRRKDEFLAMLAHELRNPLAPIRNAAQVLKLVGPAEGRQQWAREVIERQTQHLTRLVDDLLDVSRITRGKVQLTREPLDLETIVHRAVEAIRPLIEARRHQLTVALSPEPVRLEGDLTRLVQVVGNLLNNAAKYTEEGGQIRIEAARDGEEAVLRVFDDGMGVPADLLPHVFDLFTQADRSLDRSQGGLGIGLTLVRQLVELHGGRVEARSEGRGSEFIVRLPALASSAAADVGATAGENPLSASRGLKVLIVEDNVDSAEMMSFMLQLGGHEVRTVYSGPEALEAARSFEPQVVLCDIGLPGMNGYEVAARLREQPAFERTPLIALTGYGQEEARQRAREAGFDHHLVKPVEPDTLAALLDTLRL